MLYVMAWRDLGSERVRTRTAQMTYTEVLEWQEMDPG